MTDKQAPATLRVAIELRAEGEALRGVIIQEGRAARGGRAEVFAPMSIVWPAEGIAILDRHRGPELARALPTRSETGEIRIETEATQAIRAAISAGRRYLSIEFHPIAGTVTKGGVREFTRAAVFAAALVSNPEYHQATAEVREGGHKAAIWELLK